MCVADKPTHPRKGEQLDSEIIGEFLRDTIPGINGKLKIQQFPSGFSNLTYLISSGDREFILRRPPFGTKAKTAHDMSREYRMLSALKSVFPYCPEPILYNSDENIIGSSFYLMERIPGIILRKDMPKELQLKPRELNKLCENLVDVLCKLHSIDYKEIGLEKFGNPVGYVRRQVEGWSRRYRAAKTDDAPDFEEVMEWLHNKMPDDSIRASIVHNDFKFDNVVLKEDNPVEIIGVLDWEMSTIGDSKMDLGNSLAYWVEPEDDKEMHIMRMIPTTEEGMITRGKLISMYSKKMGIDLEPFDFYYCFGLFRLAVIAQQIYYRYYHGQTKDDRFAFFKSGVKSLRNTAMKIVQKSNI